MKRQSEVFKLVEMAMYAAMIVLAIQFIRIPMPSAISNSMIHPGNALVAISGLLMGCKRGLIASSLGLFIFDVLNGYGVPGAIETVLQSVVIILLIELVYKMMRHQDSRMNVILIGVWAALLKIVLRYLIFFTKQLMIGTTFKAALATALTGMPATFFTAFVTIVLVPVLYFALKPIFARYHAIGE
ncbi:ECF transporter S component [Aerococcaceae bacterium zg-ZUI334]|uniref:ECF transporter S component n=1 Tax=Aerococcaceae bacterium zg-252 TaxID=2796928 RepID=UPI001B8F65FB|nr:ECF transporter S component [Aerococcaceae bacterium zg-ZUI334]